MPSRFIYLLLIVIILGGVFGSGYDHYVAFAQNSSQTTAEQAASATASRDELQQQLDAIEKEIAQYEAELTTTTTQKNTLNNKISQLKKQQTTLQLQIKETSLRITDLTKKLDVTVQTIQAAQARLNRLQEQMSHLIILIQSQERIPIWYRVLASSTIAQAFEVIAQYTQVLHQLDDLQTQTTVTKADLENQQHLLTDQQDQAENLLSIKTLQQQKLVDSVKQQSTLLEQTKGKESVYQKSLSDAQARASLIRNRLYQLLGISTQIDFGQALEIAQWVSQETGIRPAFLLGVLTQESNLGKNVGTCNRPGDPPSKSWRVVMKPSRDQVPFQQITKELGLNPDIVPISCPMRDSRGNQIGWGGAMGPAQFIPSTWMGYREKVSALTGHRPANPWDIRDAFVAAGIKLVAGGAGDGTRQGEWNAAMRYFSGSTNTRYRFYGDNVLALADGYQSDIDELSKQ